MAPKTVLITGCSDGGIGAALATVFQKHGLRVFATARNVAKMASLANLPNVTLLALDVTSQTSIDAAADEVKKLTGGTLDYLVNNSGLAYSGPAVDANLDTLRGVFDVNYFGQIATTQAFVSLIVKAKGTIVNICTTAAHVDLPWNGMYSSSKAAYEQFSNAMRLEMKRYGVGVLNVIAGGVSTQMAANSPRANLGTHSYFKQSEKERVREESGASLHKRIQAPLVFAEAVVSDILKGKTGKVWRGTGASFIWLVSTLLPQFAVDLLFESMMGARFEKA